MFAFMTAYEKSKYFILYFQDQIIYILIPVTSLVLV